jgi:3-hydroxyacyl-CoA dehydrogenase / enoyl-CoA hydratase / 3-hydroxybutyryl-CoA epimerase
VQDAVRLEPLADGLAAIVLDSGDAPFTFDETRLGLFTNVVSSLASRQDLRGVVVRSTHRDTFCAGADVDSIAAVTSRAEIQRLVMLGQNAMEALSRLPMPVVALIHGTCVGGGLELALACTARVATDQARLGLPETKLGILPAWGGSTRLPRLIGLVPAIELITAGKVVNAQRARRLGLVDSIAAFETMLKEASRFIELTRGGEPLARAKPPAMTRFLASTGPGRNLIAKKARARILTETRGHYPAPLAALDVILKQHGKARAEGFDLERQAVADLLEGPVARELLRLFRISRDSARPPIYAESSSAPPVKNVAVIGAGVMGAGIAQVCAAKGLAVRIVDSQPASLARARAAIDDELKRLVQRRDLTEFERRNRMMRVTFSTGIDGLAGLDLVIEAVPERRDVKDSVLRMVAAQVRRDALVATNTSSFALGDLMTSVAEPSRFLGLHFFNPAPKMPLVEVVRGPQTSDAALRRGIRFARDIGKTPLVVNDGPGFIVNRLLAPYFREACKLAADGVPITAIDGALEEFGMPMGPFLLMDTVGLDVLADVSEHLSARAGGDPLHDLVRRLAERRQLGRKSGRGFYVHRKNERVPNPDATEGVLPFAGWLPLPRDISRRLVDVMIVEARAALAEKLVASPEEIDLATVFGIGFPPFRGGLMRYAATLGSTPAGTGSPGAGMPATAHAGVDAPPAGGAS